MNSLPDNTTIHTERLVLRPLTTADIPAIFKIARDKQSIEDFQYVATKVEDVEKWLAPSIEDRSCITWLMQKEGQAVGLFEVCFEAEYSDWEEDVCYVGYFLDRKVQKQGLTTEALQGVIKWLFTETTMKRIEAAVTTHNVASSRLLEKAGFVKEKVVAQDWKWYDAVYDTAYYYLHKDIA